MLTTLIYNQDYTSPNNSIQFNFSNTYLSSEGTNRSQASILFHNANTNSNQINNSEHRLMMSRNLIRPEQQHKSSSQLSTILLDDILNSYSSAGYNLTNRSQESLYQQNSHIQNSASSLYKNNESSILELTDKELIINLVMEQCKLLFLHIRNPTKKICEILIKKIVLLMDFISKEFKQLFRKIHEYFDNFWHTFNKDIASLAKDLLVKNCNPTNENIEKFVAEKPSYSKDVLTKIKKLDQLTFQLTIPSASQCNYVNKLELNQTGIELSLDNE
ncbi:9275_t:CDS:2 [Scutellospora calospora]|uniref:9275_t:CDS:1 n=1 Tax=Scutellospora calospora TaxID=85575 RepID=A0ACA9LEM6_9GLOM|nr:9275_t:CDS:2 [Scutellospora calospora]